jgi:Lipoxygenase
MGKLMALINAVRWFFRCWFWNLLAFIKMAGNKPLDIPVPPSSTSAQPRITPMPLAQAVPELPINNVLVCPPDAIPADEVAKAKQIVYRLQLWLYKHYPAMQVGLPPVDGDAQKALQRAYTWLHRKKYPAPELPAEYLGSPELGELAVRGPYACYTELESEGHYQWDLLSLSNYEHVEGLHKLGVKVRFRLLPTQRALRAFEIHTELGVVHPGHSGWELAKQIALCAVSTHMSLVRHFNWVHLAGGAHFAIASRNHLPGEHPLCRLLWPYYYGTQQSNDIVTRGQMVRGGDFETTFSFSFEGMCQLFGDTYLQYPFAVNDPELDGQRRGVRGVGFDTPSQDNLEALFAPMLAHARDYLGAYYRDTPEASATAQIRADAAVLAWLDELNALIPGGVEVSRDTVSLEALARLIARFIYLATVQHELMGSHLWNYQLWTQRQPVRVYKNGQREPLDVYQRLVNANYNLNVTRRALLHDFGYLALDAPGRDAMAKFERELAELQAKLDQQPWTVWKMVPAALKVNINA